ncbi:MAG: flagellar hook-length control protein FliK [Methylorubrum populi]
MRSLDTLSPPRPKPEAGRPSAGEEAGARAAPGFKALLGSLKDGPASADESETAASKEEPAAAQTPQAAGVDASGSVLQALMTLAGGGVPAAAPTPEAGLAAMVQRAAARSGATALSGGEGAAPQVSVLGLETHFAPVRPGGLAAGGPEDGRQTADPTLASPAVPAAGGIGDGPADREGAAEPHAVPPPPARLGDAVAATPSPTAARAVLARPDAERPPPSRQPPDAAPAAIGASGNGSDPSVPVSSGGPPPADALPLPSSDAPAARAGAAPARPAFPDGAHHPSVEAATAAAASTPSPHKAPASMPVAGPAVARTAATGPGQPPSEEPAGSDRPDSAPAATAPSVTPDRARRSPEPRTEPAAEIVRPTTDRAAQAMTRDTTEGRSEPTAGRPQGPDTIVAAPHAAGVDAAPVAVPASPQRQIVDALAAQPPAAASAAQGRPAAMPAEAGPLKILTLQLHPADLGSVLVRMRLQDGRLEMSLRTSREETAERLRNEGDLLSGLLREAGYEPDVLTIQAGGGETRGEASPRAQGLASFAGSQGGQHERQQPGAPTPDHSGRRPAPQREEAAMPTEEQDHETETRRRVRGSLYL